MSTSSSPYPVLVIQTYEGSKAIGEIRRTLGSLGEEFDFEGSRWQLSGGLPDKSGLFEFTLTLLKGAPGAVSLSLEFELSDWSPEIYLTIPAIVYAGNRFDVRKIPYPPIFSDPSDLGLNLPARITDIVRLSKESGPSAFQILAGATADPLVAMWEPASKMGHILIAPAFLNARETGFRFRENETRDQATLAIVTPGVRENYRYTMCNTSTVSDDRGALLEAGDSLTIRTRVIDFPCENIPALYERILAERYTMTNTSLAPNELPFSAAWDIQEEKYNLNNWNEGGYYMVGLGENRYQDFQIGWVGGLMNTLPLLQEGSGSSRDRAKETIDFVFSKGGQGPSGFFHGCYHKGVWSGDGFDSDQWTPQARPHPDRDHYHLLRKSADALYFLLKHFDLLARTEPEFPLPEKWVLGTRNCADAFVKVWKKYHQLGQFVDIRTGDILVGGTSSAAIAAAGLVLAADWFKDSSYLRIAEEIGEYLYREFTLKGLSNGGPGEILQCPDSESAAGLVESFTVLWEATGKSLWLVAAEHAAAQLATWQLSYDYEFPAKSEFGRLGLRSTGGVFANSQNGHGAPGLCTLSGVSYLKLYRATGNPIYARLLQELAHNLPQYLSRSDRPIISSDGTVLPPGFMNERLNTSDWDDNLGGVFPGSCWCEVSLMLTYIEVPGVYFRTDTGALWVFDHISASVFKTLGKPSGLILSNPTQFPAKVKLLIEGKEEASNSLGQNALLDCQVVNLSPGESISLPL